MCAEWTNDTAFPFDQSVTDDTQILVRKSGAQVKMTKANLTKDIPQASIVGLVAQLASLPTLNNPIIYDNIVRNADLVPCSFPSSLFDDAVVTNQGVPAGTPERTFAILNNLCRIRQTGLINAIDFKTGTGYLANRSNVTTIELMVYRRDEVDGFFDHIDTFDFTSLFQGMSSDSTRTILQFPAGQGVFCKKDDYYFIHIVTNNGDAGGLFESADGSHDPSSLSLFDGVLTTTDVDVDGTWIDNNAIPKIQPLIQAPYAVFAGDSIFEGEQGIQQDNGVWTDERSVVNSDITIPHQFELLFGKPVQNSGLGGVSTISFMLANIQERILDMMPKVVFLLIGSNDAAQDTTPANFQTDYTAFLDALDAAGIIPVILTVLPRTELNFSRSVNRQDYNIFLRAIASARNYLLIDLDPVIGETRNTLAHPYNHWNIKPEFDSGDGIHPSPLGHTRVAEFTTLQVQDHDRIVKQLS